MKTEKDKFSIEELTDKYSQEVADFFGIKKEEGLKTVVFDSMQDLARAYEDGARKLGLETKAPSYLKGFNPDGCPEWKQVWIVKPGALDENKIPIDEESFKRRLKHEICHIYINILNEKREERGNGSASWLADGVCFYIAGQVGMDPGTITLEDVESLGSTHNQRKYRVGFKLVPLIIDKYGKEKIFELLKITNKDKLIQEAEALFDWPIK